MEAAFQKISLLVCEAYHMVAKTFNTFAENLTIQKYNVFREETFVDDRNLIIIEAHYLPSTVACHKKPAKQAIAVRTQNAVSVSLGYPWICPQKIIVVQFVFVLISKEILYFCHDFMN